MSVTSIDTGYSNGAKTELETLRETLAQVHKDSREIEAELEAEIAAREEAFFSIETQHKQALAEIGRWRSQYESLRKHNEKLELDAETAHEELRQALDRVNSLETENDNLSLSGRISDSNIETLKSENHRLLEALALGEADSLQNEQLAIELQHTKDELAEAQEEIRNLQRANNTFPTSALLDQRHSPQQSTERLKGDTREQPREQPREHLRGQVKESDREQSHQPQSQQVVANSTQAKLRSSDWARSNASRAATRPVLNDARKLSQGRGHGLAK